MIGVPESGTRQNRLVKKLERWHCEVLHPHAEQWHCKVLHQHTHWPAHALSTTDHTYRVSWRAWINYSVVLPNEAQLSYILHYLWKNLLTHFGKPSFEVQNMLAFCQKQRICCKKSVLIPKMMTISAKWSWKLLFRLAFWTAVREQWSCDLRFSVRHEARCQLDSGEVTSKGRDFPSPEAHDFVRKSLHVPCNARDA